MKKVLVVLLGLLVSANLIAGGAGKFVCTQYDLNTALSSVTMAKNCVTDHSMWKSAPVTKTYESIAFRDSAETTCGFPCVIFPGSTAVNDGKDNFVVFSSGKIVIPESGDWTFSCFTDDGFELKLTGCGAEYEMAYEETRSESHTLKTFQLVAGVYDLNMTYFEAANGAMCIVSAAKGAYTSFDSSAFKLIGDAAGGIVLTETCAVVFDANGGSVMPSASVCVKDVAIGALPTASRHDYAFEGWYSDPEVGERVTPETIVDNDRTFYAHWRFDPLSVSNVRVFSGSPWQEVVIGYTIGGSTDKTVGLLFSAKDNVSGETYECRTLEGVSLSAGNHVIKWNASADGVKFKSDDVVFTIKLVEWPRYCVVDLSGGISAANYPVSYLDSVPSGGWTDEYKTTKLVLRRIEAGSMGTTFTLTKPYYVGVFEVTQKQYELVMGTNPSIYEGEMRPADSISYNMIRGVLNGTKWPSSNLVDADSFLGKLRARSGIDFDLPTEAQWEYACRAGTNSDYNNGGSTEDDLKKVGRYAGNSSDGRGGYADGTTTVGSYLPNAWGLYDMHGNVWEWCLDWSGAPAWAGDVDPKGAASGTQRKRRGGAWDSEASRCRSGSWYGTNPSKEYSSVGFRLSRFLQSGEIALGESSSVSTATDTTFANGASVDILEPISIAYGNVALDACSISANGEKLLTSEESGAYAWKPNVAGEYALSWTSGDLSMTTMVNVSSISALTPVITPADETFAGVSQLVSISCNDDKATIRYATDGSEPSAANGRVYKGPFSIYDSVTVKAIAVKDGWKDSAVASATFVKNNGLSAAINMYDCLPETDLDSPWTVDADVSYDGVKSARSGVLDENGGMTAMKVTVRGMGKLSFWWKAECEPDTEGEYYDYGVFRIGAADSAALAYIAGDSGWRRFETEIITAGKHVLRWEYHKDDAETYLRDCIWVDQVQWIPADDSGHTLTTETPVPYSWLERYGFGADTDFEVAAKMKLGKVDGAGRAMSVEDDYVAGTDPTNLESKLTATIKMGADGKPIVSWKPPLNGEDADGAGIREGVRSYSVYGKQTLDDAAEEWTPVAEGDEGNYRFFKVGVGMPEK